MADTNTLSELKMQEREARRRLILDAAGQLFAEKDFRSVTVREIAKAAGTSIGTIYNHYPNLTELFLDIFLRHAREITRILDAGSRREAPSLDRLCELYITYLNDNMTFYQMMGHFMLGGEMSAAATQKLNTVMKPLMDRIAGVIGATGIHPQPRLIAHSLFSALNGIMISYARYPGRSQEEIRRHTIRLAGLVAGIFEKRN
ncbi:MAG: TetR/AcrR family transcriptional regulator [Thermodesulfobacteriota bacterium]